MASVPVPTPFPRMKRLELQGVSRRYPRAAAPAVEGVTFSVEAGAVAALVGESGAGKSTLLRLIAGLEQPDAGRIVLDGRLLGDARGIVPPERRGIGFVFQNHALFPHLDVAGNIAFGLGRLPRAQRLAEAERLLALVRLEGRGRSMPHELSGGERQRVALARTLAPKPSLILLDEPFSSLDVALRAEVREEIRAILRGLGLTVLLVTHDSGDALSLADRITVLREGRIQQTGTPAELYRLPANRYVASFFGPCNFLPGRVFFKLPPATWRLYRPGEDEVWLRPADLQVVGVAPAAAAGGLVGRVLDCRFHGDHWEVRFRPDDPALPEILAHAPQPVRPSPAGLLPRRHAPVA